MFNKTKQDRIFKKAKHLTLSDSIVMPSGIPYEVRELRWTGSDISIECDVPNTGGARIEPLYSTPPNKKFEVR